MLSHKLLEQILLLLLIAGGLVHLLLALVVHHLLDHAAGLAVKVAELAVLGLDLGRVDLGGRSHDVGPPFHLVGLVEVDAEFLTRGGGFEGPGAVVDEDGMGEGALKKVRGGFGMFLGGGGGGRGGVHTSMIGGCPLMPALRVLFVILTSRSLPFMFAGIGAVTSRSWMVWDHLYGSLLCSSSSLAFAAMSLALRSSGVGDEGRSDIFVVLMWFVVMAVC